MKSMLEALYMDEVNVRGFLTKKHREPVTDSESFINALPPEQREKFDEIFDDLIDQRIQDNQECFVIGFKIAVRILLESIMEG